LNQRVGTLDGDVTKLGEIYEADGGTVARWIEMAQDDISGAWWQRYERWLAASFVEFLTFESEAVQAWSMQHMYMPGLLQSPDYTRALQAVGPLVPFVRPVTIHPTDFFEPPRSGSIAFGEASWGTPMYDDPLDLAELRREIQRAEAAALSEEETDQLLEQRIRETRE
jgi:Domain of unknown function (DUF5753)